IEGYWNITSSMKKEFTTVLGVQLLFTSLPLNLTLVMVGLLSLRVYLVPSIAQRTGITCAACGGHLGYVFKEEGFKTPTDERHCVNSVSVDAERAYHQNALVILEKLYTELFLLNSSGKKFWNLFHMQPMRDQKREVQYFIGVQLDDSQHVEPLHNCITENTAKEGEQLILDSGEQVL
ncbi:hypothetical protein S83_016252, partial [Arachis hypogaea]